MKKLFAVLATALLIITISGCGAQKSPQMNLDESPSSIPSTNGGTSDTTVSDDSSSAPTAENQAVHSPWSAEANHSWSGNVYNQDNTNKGLLAQTAIKVWEPMPTDDMNGYFLFPSSNMKIEVGSQNYIIPIQVSITAFQSVDMAVATRVPKQLSGQIYPKGYWIKDGKPTEITKFVNYPSKSTPFQATDIMMYLVVNKSDINNLPAYHIQPIVGSAGVDTTVINFIDGKIELGSE